MSEKIIEGYQLVSISQLVRVVREGRNNEERFCFIIGSGASVSSGIPAGATLEYNWMKEMEDEPGLKEIRETAENLTGYLEHDFKEIEAAWEKTKETGVSLPSEYYFDIYKLRFYPNTRNGYHYLEKEMANKKPSFGYHPLALILADGSGSNLVITTNFDSLIEDALFWYTDKKPLVINHELLAEYAKDPNIKRPIIAKVHRGIFFDPLNRPEDTDELKGKWHDVLASVFQNYTPIVIGYGGGDNSLMHLLADSHIKMKNGIYWCYYEKDGLPSNKIQTLVKEKNGYLVCTAGFDATMLAIGNALFPDKIGVHEVEEYLNNRTSMQIANYEGEYKRLTKCEDASKESVENEENQSENDFKKEIEKMVERTNVSEKERQESKRLTAWDYWRQANRDFDLKQYRDAIQNYSDAIQMQSNIAQFYNDRGYAYKSLGDDSNGDTFADFYYSKAIADYSKAITLNSDMVEPYHNRGVIYSILKEYNKAMCDFDKVIELNAEYADVYNDLGVVFYSLGEYDKAILEYNKAIELNPEHKDAYNNRGFTYYILQKYDEAMMDYDKAIEIDPEFANPYMHYGVLFRILGDYDLAISFLTKAIERKPSYKDAYKERMEIYRQMGETEKAKVDEEIMNKL